MNRFTNARQMLRRWKALNAINNNGGDITHFHSASLQCAELEIGCVKSAYLLHLALSGKSMRHT